MAIIISFVAFLLLFLFVGTLTYFKNKHTTADYLLAGRSVKPWLVALSAIATNNSGYMFIGMIGYTYTMGLSAIWLVIGWLIGDFSASLFIHKQLRIRTQKEKAFSFAGILSRWNDTNYYTLRIIGGIVTIVFLGSYAAAQFNAGSKALHVLFGWDYSVGALIGAGMVLIYCFIGGIRASIWTDVAQSVVMVGSMALLFFTALKTVGGLENFVTALNSVSPNYMKLFPDNSVFTGTWAPILFITGWLFSGFGVVGQPHIMIRFMAMDSPEHMTETRIYYYSWYTIFCLLTLGVGLASRVLIPDTQNFDAELSMPTLAMNLLPNVLVGLILAGIFAATMSTADSQILSCAASLTRDFSLHKPQVSYWKTKIGTLVVTSIALIIALYGDDSVFRVVMISWAALASTFAPLLTVYALGGRPSEKIAVWMALAGLSVMFAWRYFGFNSSMYELAPGMVTGFLIYGLSLMMKRLKHSS